MALNAVLAALSLALLAAPVSSDESFAYGADVGFVTEQEASGFSFRDGSGAQADPFALLKQLGVNAIRLRVWVNPSGGWNGGRDVLAKAKRAAALGQLIMVDFHYSDSFADPGQQNKPAAWADHSLEQLHQDVWSHTQGILSYLKRNGIDVEWVQVGNEISRGMLWPEGKLPDNFANLAGFINSGYQATKAVYPDAKVILHLNNGFDNAVYRWFFDGVKKAGAVWDVIGMSYYPPAAEWTDYNDRIFSNMKDMVTRYGTPVLVAEVGMDHTQGDTAKAMIADLLVKVKKLDGYGLGVFYWEPQASPGWNHYNMGALGEDGKFNAALEAFRSAAHGSQGRVRASSTHQRDFLTKNDFDSGKNYLFFDWLSNLMNQFYSYFRRQSIVSPNKRWGGERKPISRGIQYY